MDLDFTEEQEMLRTTARDFLEKECPKSLVRELEEDERGYSPELWRKMAEQGWMGLVIPEEYEGAGFSYLDLAILLEEMGRALVPGPFFSTVVLGALPILAGGTEEQKQEYLPKLANGELMLTLALAEPSARYTADAIATRAVADGEDYVINGTKLFVPDAHVADYLLCVARTRDGATPEEGISVFMVDVKSPGIGCTVLKTIAADKQCEVKFENVRVPKKNILGELDRGWELVEQILQQARTAKCAEMLGGAQQVVEMCASYAKERVQYGRPIGSFQAIQHYCADMWVDVNLARNITYEAAWHIGEKLPCASKVAIAKAWVSDVYRHATRMGVQIHGGIGFSRDHDMGLYYRRAKAAELVFGDADFQREVVAQLLGL